MTKTVQRDDDGLYILYDSAKYRPRKTEYFEHGFEHVYYLPESDEMSRFKEGSKATVQWIYAPGIEVNGSAGPAEIWSRLD